VAKALALQELDLHIAKSSSNALQGDPAQHIADRESEHGASLRLLCGTNPGVCFRPPPSVPAGRHVRKLQQRWIELNDFLKGYDGSLIHLRIPSTEKLPAVIISVVANMEDGCVVEYDVSQRKDGAIARLIERPIVLRHWISSVRRRKRMAILQDA